MFLPACPKCQSEYVYQDLSLLICPECSHEWDPKSDNDEESISVKDANGTLLVEGDKVTVRKDLKIKGSSQIIPKPPQDASVVGIKSDLGKALIANNSGSIVKINSAV